MQSQFMLFGFLEVCYRRCHRIDTLYPDIRDTIPFLHSMRSKFRTGVAELFAGREHPSAGEPHTVEPAQAPETKTKERHGTLLGLRPVARRMNEKINEIRNRHEWISLFHFSNKNGARFMHDREFAKRQAGKDRRISGVHRIENSQDASGSPESPPAGLLQNRMGSAMREAMRRLSPVSGDTLKSGLGKRSDGIQPSYATRGGPATNSAESTHAASLNGSTLASDAFKAEPKLARGPARSEAAVRGEEADAASGFAQWILSRFPKAVGSTGQDARGQLATHLMPMVRRPGGCKEAENIVDALDLVSEGDPVAALAVFKRLQRGLELPTPSAERDHDASEASKPERGEMPEVQSETISPPRQQYEDAYAPDEALVQLAADAARVLELLEVQEQQPDPGRAEALESKPSKRWTTGPQSASLRVEIGREVARANVGEIRDKHDSLSKRSAVVRQDDEEATDARHEAMAWRMAQLLAKRPGWFALLRDLAGANWPAHEGNAGEAPRIWFRAASELVRDDGCEPDFESVMARARSLSQPDIVDPRTHAAVIAMAAVTVMGNSVGTGELTREQTGAFWAGLQGFFADGPGTAFAAFKARFLRSVKIWVPRADRGHGAQFLQRVAGYYKSPLRRVEKGIDIANLGSTEPIALVDNSAESLGHFFDDIWQRFVMSGRIRFVDGGVFGLSTRGFSAALASFHAAITGVSMRLDLRGERKRAAFWEFARNSPMYRMTMGTSTVYRGQVGVGAQFGHDYDLDFMERLLPGIDTLKIRAGGTADAMLLLREHDRQRSITIGVMRRLNGKQFDEVRAQRAIRKASALIFAEAVRFRAEGNAHRSRADAIHATHHGAPAEDALWNALAAAFIDDEDLFVSCTEQIEDRRRHGVAAGAGLGVRVERGDVTAAVGPQVDISLERTTMAAMRRHDREGRVLVEERRIGTGWRLGISANIAANVSVAGGSTGPHAYTIPYGDLFRARATAADHQRASKITLLRESGRSAHDVCFAEQEFTGWREYKRELESDFLLALLLGLDADTIARHPHDVRAALFGAQRAYAAVLRGPLNGALAKGKAEIERHLETLGDSVRLANPRYVYRARLRRDVALELDRIDDRVAMLLERRAAGRGSPLEAREMGDRERARLALFELPASWLPCDFKIYERVEHPKGKGFFFGVHAGTEGGAQGEREVGKVAIDLQTLEAIDDLFARVASDELAPAEGAMKESASLTSGSTGWLQPS